MAPEPADLGSIAQSDFDALWNHDDDQGVGALRAIEQAGRDDFLMVGGAGALSAFQAIKKDDGVLKATVLYPPTMAASAIDLARALGQGKGVSGLAEFEIPSSLTLYSATFSPSSGGSAITACSRSRPDSGLIRAAADPADAAAGVKAGSGVSRVPLRKITSIWGT